MNKLYYGDNLDVLRRHIADESVDLIYLDPPFQSGKDYNVLFEERSGDRSAAQIKAFEDTWQWDIGSRQAWEEVVERGGDVSRAMQAFMMLLGESDMLAYLSMMCPRLIELHRTLKPTGSIYLHCDPTASHYLKLLLDAVFGGGNFRNEIVWSYRRYTASAKRFQRLHDIILFYAKTRDMKFNDLREEYGPKSGKADSHYKQDEEGRWYRLQKRKGKEPYKIHLSAGRRLGDVWEIPHINASARERLGYPTQKPEALLERIIAASSNPGDVVLDPFCGCGTTVSVAQRLDRGWVGIDITLLAINLIKYRLRDAFGDEAKDTYEVHGEPVTVGEAGALAKDDPFEFENWALGLVGARKSDPKKGGDKGIDGRLYFHDEPGEGETKQIVFSVKSGKTGPNHVRDLRGVLDREGAQIGVLITFQEPTREMTKEAASAGFYESPWGKHPKLQILTIQDLLDSKKIDFPPARQVDRTFKKAPKVQKAADKQLEFGSEDAD